jgi:hypothetical protein
VLASAVGPLLVAESNTSAGTYNRILLTFAAIAAAFSAVAFVTPVPAAAAGAWQIATEPAPAAIPQESLS